MLRFVIFTTLICVALAKVGSYQRYRRQEGNENLDKYYRPKYVYKFHGEDESDEDSGQYHGEYKTEYKYHLNNGDDSQSGEVVSEEEEVQEHHPVYHKPAVKYQQYHQEKEPEKITHYGYGGHHQSSSISDDDDSDQGVQKDTEHHVEIKHEHGTSHQSFKMHHFHPAKVFIKKQDHQYLKKPIEVGVTKHSFKFVHPKKTEKKVEIKPKKLQFSDELEVKSHIHHPSLYKHYKEEPKPKYEFHISKEMDTKPKKVYYHEYIKPSYVHKEEFQKKKYDFKNDYSHYLKDSTPKIEYHVPKEYQHYHQQHYVQKPQKHQHYTTYRGNTGSSEENVHFKDQMDEDSSEEPHDIHVYH